MEGAALLQMCKHALFRWHSNRTSDIFISRSLRWYQRIQRGGNTQETSLAMVSTAKTIQYIRREEKEQGWTVKSVSGDRLVYLRFAIDIAKHHKWKQSTRFLRDTAASCLPLLHNCYLFVLTVFFKCKISNETIVWRQCVRSNLWALLSAQRSYKYTNMQIATTSTVWEFESSQILLYHQYWSVIGFHGSLRVSVRVRVC